MERIDKVIQQTEVKVQSQVLPITNDDLEDIAFRDKTANIPPKYKRCSFANFKVELQPAAFNACQTFMASNADALVLCSSGYGVGKTHLLSALINAVCENMPVKPYPVHYVSEYEMISSIRDTYNPDSQLSELQMFAKYNRFPLLVIDDVGKVKPKDLSYVQQIYYRIVEYRYVHEMKIALATNLCGDELESFIGGAVASRLIEMTQGKYFVTMRGTDYRLRSVKK